MPPNHTLQPSHPPAEPSRLPAEIQQEILRAIAGIDYGAVEIVIHNSRVIQIEVRRKKRFDAEARASR